MMAFSPVIVQKVHLDGSDGGKPNGLNSVFSRRFLMTSLEHSVIEKDVKFSKLRSSHKDQNGPNSPKKSQKKKKSKCKTIYYFTMTEVCNNAKAGDDK